MRRSFGGLVGYRIISKEGEIWGVLLNSHQSSYNYPSSLERRYSPTHVSMPSVGVETFHFRRHLRYHPFT